MTYSGIQMFMEKLNQLISCKDNPSINIPSIKRKRPQFQLLYDELDSLIQTLFIQEHQDAHEHGKFTDLKKKFIYAAEEAEYIIDLFLSDVHIQKSDRRSYVEMFLSCVKIRNNEPSLNLEDVRRSFMSVQVEYKSIMRSTYSMQMDSSPRPEKTLNQSAAAVGISHTRNSQRSRKLLDEIIVGFDGDAELIRDKLVEDHKKLDVFSIVGMGGVGKTTLATKVFSDPFVVYHFEVRVWVTVSQTFDKRGVLIQILDSIRAQLKLKNSTTDSELRDLVHKHLMGKRYLIVIDDIWHIQTWDEVKLFFPHDNTRSRILLTSRLAEVAKHANADGFIHHLGCLSKENGWELLCKMVFHGNECPKWSIEPGMQIIENCKGLPLSVVVIAGILAKAAWSKELWVEIADKTGSYIVSDQNGCLETLALSYNHLPLHLRECFLYLGGFPEDHKFHVQRLIWLWVAEGFIQQAGNGSLEDIAESYLMDLVDRNLVIVSHRRVSNGAIRACTLHDLVRELCLRKAKEEEFILKTKGMLYTSNAITPPYKPVRMFTNQDINIHGQFPQNLRSIMFFIDFGSLGDDIAKFMLLRVLDLQRCSINYFPESMKLLVHLRYLAIWKVSAGFPSSICNLWGLQTLIYITKQTRTVLPRNISNLVNLRHLWNYPPSSVGFQTLPFILDSIKKPMNLRTISTVVLSDGAGNYQKYFPYIKELRCTTYADKKCDFKSLTCLEKLRLTNNSRRVISCITFPATMRALTLVSCRLPWSDMSVMHSLPNLEVLKLKYDSIEGNCWNINGQEFRQLKFLRLDALDIERWEACAQSFPSLRQLEVYSCSYLEEIPLEIGDIPTLELIRIRNCSESVNESVRIIQEEQNDLGNNNLKIEFRRNW